MEMKNGKKLKSKRYLLQSVGAIIVVVAVYTCIVLGALQMTNRQYYFEVDDLAQSYTDVTLENEDVVRIVSVEKKGDDLAITLEPAADGECGLTVNTSSDIGFYTIFKVTPGGIIEDLTTGTFTGSDTILLCLCLFTLTLAVIMWVNYFRVKSNIYFSYQPMFYSGFGIWLSVMAVVQIVGIIRMFADADRHSASATYVNEYFSEIAAAGTRLMTVLTPFLVVFAVFMIISNISLMRHESKRPTNAIGMALGVIMVAAEAVLIWLINLPFEGSETEYIVMQVIIHSLTCIFSVAECFLLGSIICGFGAARKEPKYNRDFIIILGCRIKKDGTLYPLVRGRVDRAIRFYYKQLEATGKKAVFVPSGGKGSDEMLSEGEAMKRYLLEQGIPEEQIMAETESKNTLENMKFSSRLIFARKPGAKIAFSTTNYHVLRSGILAVQAGVVADGMGSKTKWYFWPNAFIREFFGLVAYCRIRIAVLAACLILLLAIVQITLVY